MDTKKTEKKLLVDKLDLIESWDGSDPRWWHRDGGEPFQGKYWIDRFTARNPAMSVSAISNKDDCFDLDPGTYHLVWDAHLVFREPACRYASASYMAMMCTAHRLGAGSGNPQLGSNMITEVYACAQRDGLIYDLGIQLTFRVRNRQESVDFSFYAANDEDSGRLGATNIKEVIVYKMEFYKIP